MIYHSIIPWRNYGISSTYDFFKQAAELITSKPLVEQIEIAELVNRPGIQGNRPGIQGPAEFIGPSLPPTDDITIEMIEDDPGLSPGQQLIADAGKDVFGQLLINMGVYLLNPASPTDANPVMVGPQDEIVGVIAIGLGTLIKWV